MADLDAEVGRIETLNFDPDAAARALRVFLLDQELRADREPPLHCCDFRAKYDERQRLLASLGWRPNRGR